MISYNAIYTSGVRPYLAKTVSIGEESFETKLSSSMSNEELVLIPLSSIYEHQDNIVLYIQDLASTLSAIRLDDESIDFSSPISGYKEIESAYDEAYHWFEYIFKNREPEEITEGTPA